MKNIRFLFSIITIICLCVGLLAAPLVASNRVIARSATDITPGWELELTLPPASFAHINEIISVLQADGLQVSLDGSQLKVSSTHGTDELRRVLYETIAISPISARADLVISLPMLKDEVLTLKLPTNAATGYGWELADSEGVPVIPDGAPQITTTDNAPQITTLVYRSTETGLVLLNLAYRRPFGQPETSKFRITLRLPVNPPEIDLTNPNPPSAAFAVEAAGPVNQPVQALDALPESWDWRTQGVVSPIRDQGACGASWAFSATGAMESSIKINGGPLTDLSEQFLISCNEDGQSCDYSKTGMNIMKYYVDTPGKTQAEIGAVLESALPYAATDGTCETPFSHPYQAVSWNYVSGSFYTQPGVDQIKNAIYSYGPISAGVCVGPQFRTYTNGIFTTDESSSCASVNHTIMLVGWDDATQTWILRNSWGEAWGESGYMHIRWDISRVGLRSAWVLYTPPITVPTALLPNGKDSDTTPTYQWSAINSATQYQLQVYRGTTMLLDQTITSPSCSAGSCSFTPAASLSLGDYSWMVRAYRKDAWGDYSNAKSFTITAAGPKTVSPNTSIYLTTPAYKWTAVSGATRYQVQVYRGKAKVIDRTYTASQCSRGYCTARPSTALLYTGHTWRVSAYVKGVWTAYSQPAAFSVTSGFSSDFSSNSTGWSPIYAAWSLDKTEPGVYKTSGAARVFSSAAYTTAYSQLDYQARLKRLGCSRCANYLEIRGTTAPLRAGDKAWNKSYRFQYTNSGLFSVYKINGPTDTPLVPWTASAYIYADTWNTLRVVASGDSFKYYLNDHLVWSGTDASYTTGKVGIGMYTDSSTGNLLSVDWVNLISEFVFSESAQIGAQEETQPENTEWTSASIAPR